jgi:hypothetical protein
MIIAIVPGSALYKRELPYTPENINMQTGLH